MADFEVRQATRDDALPMAQLLSDVAEEGGLSATEPPVDVKGYAEMFAPNTDATVVAYADEQLVGGVHTEVSKHGFGKVGLIVHRDWRGKQVGSALLSEAIDWSRAQGLHKLAAETFAHNSAPISLYKKFGFVEEGRRSKHYRRANGEFHDSVVLGLIL
jgi:RimJ/RimL family protein N-acetyltransferase